ncbi:hypothetical protein HY622_00220 [Candidatus Uhrbacteria bacterium]|nr:hypothetical protein [Candidatus Uhrbacteria bacterium]
MATEEATPIDQQKAARKQYFDDPEMQRIAQEIAALRERAAQQGASANELFEGSFVLSAQLGDERREKRGEPRILEQAYRDAWNDPDVRQAYGDGKNGDLRDKGMHKPLPDEEMILSKEEETLLGLHPEISSDAGSVEQTHDLLAIHFDARAIDMRLLRTLVRSISHGGEKQWQLRDNDMKEGRVPDGIRALLALDMLANEARTLMRALLAEYQPMDPSLPADYVSSDKARDAYRDKLLSAKTPTDAHRARDERLDTAVKRGFNLAYLKGLEERLSTMVQERAQSLYKDDAEKVMNLWRAVNYLKSSKLKPKESASDLRQSVYGALKEYGTLKEESIKRAESIIRPRVIRNPEAFTPAAQHSLGVLKEEIRNAQVERGDTTKMTEDEKARYEREKKQHEEDEKLQPLKQYIGKVLYDTKNDRLIFCIGGGKISRTRTSYDRKRHKEVEKASDIPGMEVRYFPRPRSGMKASANQENGIIKPGAFLTRIQSGEYQLRDDISISGDTKEIDTKLFPKE